MSTAVLDIQKAKIAGIQELVEKLAQNNDSSPYLNTHHFAEGIYVRAGYAIKGAVIVSRVHLHESVTVLCGGHCRIISTMQNEERVDVYKDFAILTTAPMTKRVLYFLENTTMLCVYPNPDNIRDIAELERMFVVDDFKEIE